MLALVRLCDRLLPPMLRTDLGGPTAPHPMEHVLPGALVPALVEDDTPSGLLYRAQVLRA